MRQTTLRAGAALTLAGAGCVAYGTMIERRWYRLSRLRIEGVLPGRGARCGSCT